MKALQRRIVALERVHVHGEWRADDFIAWERALPADAPERLQARAKLAEWNALREAGWATRGQPWPQS